MNRAATPAPGPIVLGESLLRGQAHVHDLPSLERELARLWSGGRLATAADGVEERRVAARTSVMNLVVIARSPEVGERCAAVIARLTGRHPSRTLVVLPMDPDGPSWIDADIQAHCVLPRPDAAEVCSERVLLRVGGESGRHLGAVVAPLLIHDLPVTAWWPGELPFGSASAQEILDLADRLVVDGSSWSGNGLGGLVRMADVLDNPDLVVSDFALIRQSRWREAIASTFDLEQLRPYLYSLREITITYATGLDGGTPGVVNLVKPLYHAAWLASRLGLTIERPLEPGPDGPDGRMDLAGWPPGYPARSEGVSHASRWPSVLNSRHRRGGPPSAWSSARNGVASSCGCPSRPRPRRSWSTPPSAASRLSIARSWRRDARRLTCWPR